MRTISKKLGIGILALTSAVFVFSCGGGGGGGETVTVTEPAQLLTGTYTLSGFYVEYSDFTYFDDTMATTWSGQMKLGSDTISQTMSIDGKTLGGSGTFEVYYTNYPSEGVLVITDSSGTHYAAFLCDGMDFYTYSGVMGPIPGTDIYFEEWDHWTKVSDSLAPERTSSEETQEKTTEEFKLFGFGEKFYKR